MNIKLKKRKFGPIKYSYHPDAARYYGIREALLLDVICFWVGFNRDKAHFYKGRYWMYNSAKAFAEVYDWWSEDVICTLLSSLERQGAIQSAFLNRNPWDKTKWYTTTTETDCLVPRLKKTRKEKLKGLVPVRNILGPVAPIP